MTFSEIIWAAVAIALVYVTARQIQRDVRDRRAIRKSLHQRRVHGKRGYSPPPVDNVERPAPPPPGPRSQDPGRKVYEGGLRLRPEFPPNREIQDY